MNLDTFYNLSLATQVALGAGFLAYGVAYAGLRESHGPVDAVFITLAFSVVATLAFMGAQGWGVWSQSAFAFLIALIAAALWRRWIRRAVLWLFATTRVHREDGVHRSWASIVQTDRRVGQISVHTKDGRILYLNDRQRYSAAPWGGLYLGGDGAIVMVVEEEEFADGKEEMREDISDPHWGTRMTYIPAGEIARVNIRMK